MNMIIFNLNVSILDTFVQRIMMLTVRKLQIDSRKKQFVPRIDSERARREGAVTHRRLRCNERERTLGGQEGAVRINALCAALQLNVFWGAKKIVCMGNTAVYICTCMSHL